MTLTPNERKRVAKLLQCWAETYRAAGKGKVSADLKEMWSRMGDAYSVAGKMVASGTPDWCRTKVKQVMNKPGAQGDDDTPW